MIPRSLSLTSMAKDFEYRWSPTSTDASSPHWALAEGRPRRSGAWSTTSSWIKVAVWRSSPAQARRTDRGPRYPANRAASSRSMGRSRLPPASAMYAPISWMRATGEPSWRRISPSTDFSSSPTSAATRSLRTCSRVGEGTRGPLLGDDAVFDLDVRARGHRLDLGHRKPVAQLGHARRPDLLVELTEHLARHRMHDGDAVTPQTDHGPRPHAVGGGEVDDDPGRVHVDDESALGLRRRQRRGHGLDGARLGRGGGSGGGHGAVAGVGRGRRLGHALARTDLPAPWRLAILGNDLGLGDDGPLSLKQCPQRRGNLVFLDPDVLGLAGHVAEAGIQDEEPPGLGRPEGDRRLARCRHAGDVTHRRASGHGEQARRHEGEPSYRHPGPTIAQHALVLWPRLPGKALPFGRPSGGQGQAPGEEGRPRHGGDPGDVQEDDASSLDQQG